MSPAWQHGKTVDYGMKLSSLMSAPMINDVPTLDKLTALELNCLILHELSPKDDAEISYVLSQIFSSFTFQLPDVTELQVPLHKFRYRDDRLHRKFATTHENDLAHLYDKDECQWNWPLPKSHHDNVEQWLLPSDGSLGDWGEESAMADVESGSRADGGSSLEEVPPLDTPSPPFKGVFAMFFNVLHFALAQKVPRIVQETNPVQHLWSAGNSTCPVKDEEVSRKPDLALLDDVEARWDTIKAVCELTLRPYSATGTIGNTLDNKVFLLFRRQPWRQFVLLMSVTKEYCELRVHMYDHSGAVVMPPINIDTHPNDFLHIFSCLVFGKLECLGYDPSIVILTKTLRPAQLECASTFLRPSVNRSPAPDTMEGVVESIPPPLP
ncbi:hypothetical protein BDR06DRAFT_1005943 [Suillus hirtellus]|nr:hypothetical protein BDR06DRAFT_1005943 [Suillus hirtellus]